MEGGDALLFDRARLLDALEELVAALRERGVRGGIRVVGGAALALEHDHDRAATRDIDAYLHPSADVLEVAYEIAVRRGWPQDWINDKALMFMSHHDDASDWRVILDTGGVIVSVASAHLLFAMKAKAARGLRDGQDLLVLAEVCGVRQLRDGEEIFERYYPDEVMKPRAARWLGAWLRDEDPFAL